MLYCIASDQGTPKICKRKCKEAVCDWGDQKYVNVNVKNQYVKAVV